MHLVIHVGPHKTGTSYIQTIFLKNRDVLAERGWIYPEAGTQSDGSLAIEGHHDVAHHSEIYLDQPDNPRTMALVDAAKKAAAAGKGMLLSAEGFRNWWSNQFRKLADILGATEVDLVYTVRCPYTIFYSYWAEEVKQGRSGSIQTRFLSNFTNPERSHILNPYFDLDRYVVEPSLRINLIYFDAARKRGLDLCDLITGNVLGIESLPKAKIARVNESFSVELTEFLRLLTFRHARTKAFTNSRFRLAFMSTCSPEDLAEITRVLNTHAKEVFNFLALPRDNSFYADLKARLAASPFHRKMPEDGHLDLPDTPLTWQLGDIGMLMMVPEVVALVEKHEERLKKLGF